MNTISRRLRLAACAVLLSLVACGGGGDKPADVVPSTAFPTPAAVSGPDRFLLWVNPLTTPSGSPAAIDTEAYARAYYAAIDPFGTKRRLADWKTANGFGQPGGIEASAIFGDFRDLGYGRRMSGRCDADPAAPTRCAPGGRIAFVVENFLVNPGAEGYGARINLDAAIVDDRQWIVSVNAIEFGVGPDDDPNDAVVPSVRYARFYSFDPLTGERRLTQNLDGRGEKALPGACIACHGGRADALTNDGRMPLLQGSERAQRGDVRGHLHPFEVDALTFADTGPRSSAAQQAALKTLNRIVLCTIPYTGAMPAPLADDRCRDAPRTGEWQGDAAADLIHQAYAPGMSAASYQIPPTPAGWTGTAGGVDKAALHRRVVGPTCLGCHRLLGSSLQSDIDFSTFEKFRSHAERTRQLVYQHGNMPLSRVLFGQFWSTAQAGGSTAKALADYLRADLAITVPTSANGEPRPPGAPVAIAGPDRRVAVGTTTLSAARSLFADSYRWTLLPGTAGVTLDDTTSVTARLTATAAAAGQRAVVRLVASRGGVDSEPVLLTVYVNAPADGYPDPSQVRFAQVKTLLGACTGCHAVGGTPKLAFTGTDAEIATVLRSRINFTDIAASQLLRKPSGEHHDGGLIEGYCLQLQAGNAAAPCFAGPGEVAGDVPVGSPRRAARDTWVDWALSDARS